MIIVCDDIVNTNSTNMFLQLHIRTKVPNKDLCPTFQTTMHTLNAKSWFINNIC